MTFITSPAAPQRPEYLPRRIDDPSYVRIFDTTLRDGEQSPGATLTIQQKLDIARQLKNLRVDIIEAGFPIASPDDFEAVKLIAEVVGNDVDPDGFVPVICGMARAKRADLERCWEAVRYAKLPRVHTSIATSDIHLRHKLRMTREQAICTAVDAVTYVREMGCTDIEIGCEDAGRSDPQFLYQILGELVKAGATTINIPDTTGWNMPHEYANLIAGIKANVPGIDSVILSTHCHDDLGLSVANSLAGVMAGCRQIECTINGIGERAGNASLEELVMAIALRGQQQMGGLWTGILPVHLYPTSKLVSECTGMPVQPNKAIVGANAFSHESGIHQDGMLKCKDTYQIMSPEALGWPRREGETGIVLGKHSGRSALHSKLKALGHELVPTELDKVFKRFKVLADKKKTVSDDDLLALVGDEASQPVAVWSLLGLQVMCGTVGKPSATVQLQGPDGAVCTGVASGSGPVNAAYKAVDSIIGVGCELMDYSMSSMNEGIDALAQTRVVIRPAGHSENGASVNITPGAKSVRNFSGAGAANDIVVSSVHAYIVALNKMISSLGLKCKAKTKQPDSIPVSEGTVTFTTNGLTSPMTNGIVSPIASRLASSMTNGITSPISNGIVATVAAA